MNNEERLSLAYSDIKDKYFELKLKYSFLEKQYKELTEIRKSYLDLCKRYRKANDFLNKLLKEKWHIRELTEDEKAAMLKL